MEISVYVQTDISTEIFPLQLTSSWSLFIRSHWTFETIIELLNCYISCIQPNRFSKRFAPDSMRKCSWCKNTRICRDLQTQGKWFSTVN